MERQQKKQDNKYPALVLKNWGADEITISEPEFGIADIKNVDSVGDNRSKPRLPMKHRWLCQRGLGPPLSFN